MGEGAGKEGPGRLLKEVPLAKLRDELDRFRAVDWKQTKGQKQRPACTPPLPQFPKGITFHSLVQQLTLLYKLLILGGLPHIFFNDMAVGGGKNHVNFKLLSSLPSGPMPSPLHK